MDLDIDEQKVFSVRKLRKTLNVSKTKRSRRKSIRRPRNTTRKWKVAEELVILDYFRNVIRQNQEIEKPTADVFYAKLIEDLKLEDASPTQTKNKVRHLRDSYIRAVKWMQQTGQDTSSSWVRQCVLEICTHYDILSEIYGDKLDIDSSKVQPKHYFETSRDAVGEPRDEDSGREFVSYEPDSENENENSNQLMKQDIDDDDEPLQQSPSNKNEGIGDESLHCFKQFLSSTSEAINRAFPSPAPSLASSEPHRPKKVSPKNEAHSAFEEKWKIEELKLQQERLQLEKLKQEWQRDIKEKELEVRRKEIETNERLRILEIEKEERMEKFKIEQECKLQLELASIKNSDSKSSSS
ncbi:DNA ligase 1-like [Eupeodes corollae]|uniref:DNA ligase 1-like n=1 Tax=Eupeodes corollae TaxID=290404 RepID=UPI002491E567|nr:DNA ligase 1-like [Eupeodes corollae]